jgi:pimeloyl-ACP methyl ester carboxylesterase
LEPQLTRSDLGRPGVRLLNRGGFANPDVLLVPVAGGPPVVVKDYGYRSCLVRWLLAPFLVRHELEMLKRVAGLPGLPGPRGRIDHLAFAMEYIDGVPLRRRSHRGTLPRAFFDGLEGILDGLSLRGVVYMDLRSCKNVLQTRATDAPALVDLASAYRLRLPRALIQVWDRYALAKLRERFEGFESSPGNDKTDLQAYEELALGSLRIHFMDRGRLDDPVPALFLHDVGHSAEVFRSVLEQADSHARRAIGLDLPGFGGSRMGRCRLALPQLAKRIEEVCQALRLSRVDLVGCGWGGLIARTLAERRPQLVRSLLTLDTPIDGLVGRFLSRWEEARRDPEVLRRRLLQELPAGLSPAQQAALGNGIKAASAVALRRAYAGVRVRKRSVRDASPGFVLRNVPTPRLPWLAVSSESREEGERSQDRSSALLQTEWWSQPLADPPRLWHALERLAG